MFDENEYNTLSANLSLMRSDIRILYSQSLDSTHQGFPSVREIIHSGRRGRPQIVFDPDFLAWAYNRRSISALSRFLRVGRTTIRNALIAHGLISQSHHPETTTDETPQDIQIEIPISDSHSNPDDPSTGSSSSTLENDNLLEPPISHPLNLPSDVIEIASSVESQSPSLLQAQGNSGSIHHSNISDDDLDDLVIRLRFHFRRAGIRMLDGMLRRLGYRIQIERIRQSLLRIDPVRRVFERIRIRRRTYSVAGPNALWHHDGQHGERIGLFL